MLPSAKRGPTLLELSERFATRESCEEFLQKLRWPNGPVCPRCGSANVTKLATRRVFQCKGCRHQFSVTSGTIFHNTRLPLRKWVLAAALICNAKKGLSAKQVERHLRVTYKTAWSLMHRIRKAMKGPGLVEKFVGIVEVDETYLGGKSKLGAPRKPGHVIYNKMAVVGVRKRNGGVRGEVVTEVSAGSLGDIVRRHVARTAKMLCTDEHQGYLSLRHEYNPQRVNHSQEEWVRGEIHTNSIESFWNILKRGIVGSFHKVSLKYLQAYVDEFAYRFSHTGCSNGVGLWKTLLRNGLQVTNGHAERKG